MKADGEVARYRLSQIPTVVNTSQDFDRPQSPQAQHAVVEKESDTTAVTTGIPHKATENEKRQASTKRGGAIKPRSRIKLDEPFRKSLSKLGDLTAKSKSTKRKAKSAKITKEPSKVEEKLKSEKVVASTRNDYAVNKNDNQNNNPKFPSDFHASLIRIEALERLKNFTHQRNKSPFKEEDNSDSVQHSRSIDKDNYQVDDHQEFQNDMTFSPAAMNTNILKQGTSENIDSHVGQSFQVGRTRNDKFPRRGSASNLLSIQHEAQEVTAMASAHSGTRKDGGDRMSRRHSISLIDMGSYEKLLDGNDARSKSLYSSFIQLKRLSHPDFASLEPSEPGNGNVKEKDLRNVNFLAELRPRQLEGVDPGRIPRSTSWKRLNEQDYPSRSNVGTQREKKLGEHPKLPETIDTLPRTITIGRQNVIESKQSDGRIREKRRYSTGGVQSVHANLDSVVDGTTLDPSRMNAAAAYPSRRCSKEAIDSVSRTNTATGDNSRRGSEGAVDSITKINMAAAAASTSEEHRKGIYVTRFTVYVICFLYISSMLLIGALGFCLHAIIFSDSVFFTANSEHSKTTNVTEILQESSVIPTHGNPSSAPNVMATFYLNSKITPSSNMPSNSSALQPSFYPSVSMSPVPSVVPTNTPTKSELPSLIPSETPSISQIPSFAPIGVPICPEVLKRSVNLGNDGLIKMYYDIVESAFLDPTGGLFCVTIEFSGNAGWIGFAFSKASRDPSYGRKEAIIGITGVQTLTTVAVSGQNAAVGNQVSKNVTGQQIFFNPGKYEIPAGGADGYSGPSMNALLPSYKQTLINASIVTLGSPNSVAGKTTTQMSFTKILREPNEIIIEPYESTLMLYTVASFDESGNYNDNPLWESTYVTLLESESLTTKVKRNRFRRHHSDGRVI